LKKSFETFERKATSAERERFDVFCKENRSWLEDYSLFMALKEAHGPIVWNMWQEDIRQRQHKPASRI
jgi:4-alpha-glucanotransferase